VRGKSSRAKAGGHPTTGPPPLRRRAAAAIVAPVSTPAPRTVTEDRPPFTLSTDPARVPVEDVHRWLAEESYWARGIPLETCRRSIENALPFAIYEGDTLVAFARVVTDFATVAYLGDVFVKEAWRGRGLSKWLVEAVHAHPDLQGFRRWILLTRDAHGLYARSGWTALEDSTRWMELRPIRGYPGA